MFLFEKGSKWEDFFIKTIIVFGIVFTLLVPLMEVQDEDTHAMRSINMSYFNWDYKDGFEVFQSLYTFLGYFTEGRGIYAFAEEPDYRINHDLYRLCMRIPLDKEEMGWYDDAARTWLYGNLAYLFQGIGILIGRFFDLPIYWTLILGRMVKLVVYAMLCYWAIRLTPVKKDLFTVLALMPMPVYFAASLSPEGILVGACYLFAACILRCKFEERRITWKEAALLLVLIIFIFSVKMVYSSIVLWILLLINWKRILPEDKKQKIAVCLIGFLCVCIGLVMLYKLSPTVQLCLNNLPMTFYLYFKTYTGNFYYYLSLGVANFGTAYEPLRRRYVYIVAGYVILIAVQRELNVEKEQVKRTINMRTRLTGVGLFVIISFIIFLTGLMWASPTELTKDTYPWGIQGRYFIPFMPMLLLACNSSRLNLKWLTNEFIIKWFSIIQLAVSSVWIWQRYW